MVKILLNGCNGKMGKIVAETSKKYSEVKIICGVDNNINANLGFPVYDNILNCKEQCDVILDFSRPSALDSLLKYAEDKKIALVLCTTGYTDEQINKIENASKKISIFRSANMSIGINILNKVLKQITSKLYNDFDIEIIEKHHNQKVDSPSGTALMLGDTIKSCIEDDTEYKFGRQGNCKRTKKEIGMHSIRGGGIVGEHEIIYAGAGEILELKHTAISREVFAIGAIKACAFMKDKTPGMYSMDNLI